MIEWCKEKFKSVMNVFAIITVIIGSISGCIRGIALGYLRNSSFFYGFLGLVIGFFLSLIGVIVSFGFLGYVLDFFKDVHEINMKKTNTEKNSGTTYEENKTIGEENNNPQPEENKTNETSITFKKVIFKEGKYYCPSCGKTVTNDHSMCSNCNEQLYF